MSFTAGQIAAWKLVGTEGSTATSFDTPTQAKARMPQEQKNLDDVDVIQTTAKASADARVARRNAGKES